MALIAIPAYAVLSVDPADEDTSDAIRLFDTRISPFGQIEELVRPAEPVQTTVQAQQLLGVLEDNFRKYGDLNSILVYMPRILRLLPDNAKANALYAIALAASGEADEASGLIERSQPSEDAGRLYLALAKAQLGKSRGESKLASQSIDRAISIDPDHAYAYNLQGQILASSGDYRAALSAFDSAKTKAPRNPAAWSNLGATYLLLGEDQAAWSAYSKSIELAPAYCPALMGRSSVSAARADYANAIRDLEACQGAEPANASARDQLGRYYLLAGRLEQAESYARRHLSENKRHFSLILADISMQKGNISEARRLLKSVKSPDAQTFYLLSLCDSIEGNRDNAIRLAERALESSPDSPTLSLVRALYQFAAAKTIDKASLESLYQDPSVGKLAQFIMGNIAAAEGRNRAAFELWSDAEGMLPGFTLKGVSFKTIDDATGAAEQAHAALGVFYHIKKLQAAAGSELDLAVKANPDAFVAQYFAALSRSAQGYIASSNEHLQRSLNTAPGFFPANYLLAEQLLRQGKVDDAVGYYRAAAESMPDGGVLIKLGLLYEQKSMMKEAERSYRRFIEAYPDNFIGYNQLAWMFTRDGIRLDDALQLAEKANRLQPDNISVNDTLGWIHFQKKDYLKARRYLIHANTLSKGRNSDVLYHLAELERTVGDMDKALTYVNQALDASANFESIQQAKALKSELSPR